LTEQQLFDLAAQGDLAPDTELTTDTGYSGTAEQIPGLFPDDSESPSFTTLFTPQEDSLCADVRKKRLIALASVYASVNAVSACLATSESLGQYSLLLFFMSIYVYYLLVFRLWSEVPTTHQNKSPQTMALLSLIPFFAYYWMFIALVGLQRRMNAVITQNKEKKPLDPAYIVAACTGWLFLDCFDLLNHIFLPEDTIPINYTLIFAGLSCLFTAVACWAICKNSLQFIEIKTETGIDT
jgi:hypothetical protein